VVFSDFPGIGLECGLHLKLSRLDTLPTTHTHAFLLRAYHTGTQQESAPESPASSGMYVLEHSQLNPSLHKTGSAILDQEQAVQKNSMGQNEGMGQYEATDQQHQVRVCKAPPAFNMHLLSWTALKRAGRSSKYGCELGGDMSKLCISLPPPRASTLLDP